MPRAVLTHACVSLMFFLVTAATFNSLGVVLPSMVQALGLSQASAGSGFLLLGVFCGLSSTMPAAMIRRWGVRVTLFIGAAVMAAAFLCLAEAGGLPLYLAGCALAGLGFTLLATVPGTYLLQRLFVRPSFAIGLYFTIGGLGGVAGPPLYFWIASLGNWRSYWAAMGAAVVCWAIISALAVDTATDRGILPNGDPDITSDPWRAGEAMRTRQFFILAAAYTIFLFVGITVNADSVLHLTGRGVPIWLAGGLMSLDAFLNSGARLLGGLATRFIDPHKLLLLSLSALIVGLVALAFGRSPFLLVLYAAGIGIGYGLTFFAATILLLDYFGRGPNLELFATVNLISTIGSVGPFLAGLIADRTGSFTPAFLALAVLTGVVLLAAILMRPPQKSHPAGAGA